MERAEPQLSSSLGRITISTGAIGQIVSQTASRCYGVVEIGGGARAKVGRLLPRSRGVHGISVSGDGDSVSGRPYPGRSAVGVSRLVEGVRGNREVPPRAILGTRAEADPGKEGGSWGKHGFPHATEPEAREQ